MNSEAIRAKAAAGLLLVIVVVAVFGARAGGLALVLVAVLVTSAFIQQRLDATGAGGAARFVLIGLDVALVTGAVFAGGPLVHLEALPAPMVFFSPAAMALFCLVAAHAIGARPLATLWSGAAAMAAWTLARQAALADPATITHAMVNPDDYETLIAYLGAITRPHYQDDGVWWLQMASLAGFTLVLALAAWRARRLARRAGVALAEREGLAAHFSAAVVETLLAGEAVAREGVARAGVLDCDLTGYTAATSGLAPEAVAALLRAWHGLVEQGVFACGGAVLKFTGDGVSAIFGLASEGAADPAAQAADCARRIHAAWPTVAAGLGLATPPGLAMGLDVGPVRWGLVGEGRAVSLVVLGEPVASAARLQAATRAAGAPILVGAAAAEALATDRALTPLAGQPGVFRLDPAQAGGADGPRQ